MTKNKTMWRLSFITTLLMMGMVSCATTVPIKSVVMPTINTAGIQKLAIKPFENVSGVGGTLGAQLTQYLTDQSQQLITGTGKFTMVAPTDPNADGIFTGKITSVSSKDTQEQSTYKDKDGNTRTQTTYYREVFLEFSYSVISTRTDMAIGTVLKKDSRKDSASEPGKLPDTIAIGKAMIDRQLKTQQQTSLFGGGTTIIPGLVEDLVPRIVEENRKLMKETSKDKVVKTRMKEVVALIKAGNIEEAIAQYDKIAADSGSVAAKTNAGILREAIASDAAATAQLAELFEDKDGRAEKAIKNAMDSLHAKLPDGVTITIMKTQSSEGTMLEYVVDEMTKTIIKEGKFTVVDRSNQALIKAEQQFQLSGDVDDNSIISIGHQLGVKYIVLCWISGEKSLRRLNLKVLDVETAQITEQTNFEI